jgi:hypothetical protein
MKKNQQQNADSAVRFDAFTVTTEEGEQSQAFWHKIGVAFPHTDGKGFNVVLNSIPFDRKIVLRLHEPKPQDNSPR